MTAALHRLLLVACLSGGLLANAAAQTDMEKVQMNVPPWKKELIDAALEKVIPVFTQGMSPEEVAKAKEIYWLHFLNAYPETSRLPIADQIFTDKVEDRVRLGHHLPLAERRFLLQHDEVASRVEYESDIAFRVARKTLYREAVSEEEKSRCQQIAESLQRTSQQLKTRSPAWYAELSHTISEGLLDARYVISDGDSAVSLRLGHLPPQPTPAKP